MSYKPRTLVRGRLTLEHVYFDLLDEANFNDDTILTKDNIKKLLDLISGQTVSYSIDIIDNQDIVIDNIKLPILKDIFEKGNLKLEIRKHVFGRKFTGSKEDN